MGFIQYIRLKHGFYTIYMMKTWVLYNIYDEKYGFFNIYNGFNIESSVNRIEIPLHCAGQQ